ncbi:MAG: hypothetical protein QM736_06425 [Vicinamibacterales bacterium]
MANIASHPQAASNATPGNMTSPYRIEHDAADGQHDGCEHRRYDNRQYPSSASGLRHQPCGATDKSERAKPTENRDEIRADGRATPRSVDLDNHNAREFLEGKERVCPEPRDQDQEHPSHRRNSADRQLPASPAIHVRVQPDAAHRDKQPDAEVQLARSREAGQRAHRDESTRCWPCCESHDDGREQHTRHVGENVL